MGCSLVGGEARDGTLVGRTLEVACGGLVRCLGGGEAWGGGEEEAPVLAGGVSLGVGVGVGVG